VISQNCEVGQSLAVVRSGALNRTFLIYGGTTQRACLRLMGRKMLVARSYEDRGCIYIKDNAIEAVGFLIFDPGPSWEHHHFADESLKKATQDLRASADDTGCTADLTVASADVLTKVKQILANSLIGRATPGCVLSLQMY
jgi:hypothetical protein